MTPRARIGIFGKRGNILTVKSTFFTILKEMLSRQRSRGYVSKQYYDAVSSTSEFNCLMETEVSFY